MKHARFLGGSTVSRRLDCFGSAWLDRYISESTKLSSPAAFRGTALHWLMETDSAATYYEQDGRKYFFTEEDEVAIDEARKAVDVLKLDKSMKEVQLFIDENIGGTADLIGRKDDTLYIVDYKFGNIPVSPVRNKSLGFYLMAAMEDSAVSYLTKGVDKVIFVIIQPTQKETLNGWVLNREWFFNILCPQVKELSKFVRDLQKLSEPEAEKWIQDKLFAGPHCQFCKGKVRCSAYNQSKLKAPNTKFPLPIGIENVMDLKPTEITPYLDWAVNAKTLAALILARGQQLLDEGKGVKNYVIAPGRRKRVYKEGAEAYLIQHLGEQAYEKKLITPTQAEKLLDMKDYVEFAPGKPTLKRVKSSSGLKGLDIKLPTRRKK